MRLYTSQACPSVRSLFRKTRLMTPTFGLLFFPLEETCENKEKNTLLWKHFFSLCVGFFSMTFWDEREDREWQNLHACYTSVFSFWWLVLRHVQTCFISKTFGWSQRQWEKDWEGETQKLGGWEKTWIGRLGWKEVWRGNKAKELWMRNWAEEAFTSKTIPQTQVRSLIIFSPCMKTLKLRPLTPSTSYSL